MRRLIRSRGFVVALVVVDVLVIAAAVWLSRPRVEEPTAQAVEQATDPTDIRQVSQIQAPLLLAGGPDGQLVRATRGSCDARTPETSQVWVGRADALEAVQVEGLVETLGAGWTGDTLRLTGADADCRVRGWSSTDAGATWREGRPDTRVWRLDLDRTATSLGGPGGGAPQEVSCVPSGVQGVGSTAVAVCRDSVVRLGSTDRDPQQVFAAQGVGAAVPDGPQSMLVLVDTAGCATLMRSRTDGTLQQLACVVRGAAPLGLARTGGALYAQAGEELHVSRDGGRSFEPVGG